jgi:hypothetical protein
MIVAHASDDSSSESACGSESIGGHGDCKCDCDCDCDCHRDATLAQQNGIVHHKLSAAGKRVLEAHEQCVVPEGVGQCQCEQEGVLRDSIESVTGSSWFNTQIVLKYS